MIEPSFSHSQSKQVNKQPVLAFCQMPDPAYSNGSLMHVMTVNKDNGTVSLLGSLPESFRVTSLDRVSDRVFLATGKNRRNTALFKLDGGEQCELILEGESKEVQTIHRVGDGEMVYAGKDASEVTYLRLKNSSENQEERVNVFQTCVEWMKGKMPRLLGTHQN